MKHNTTVNFALVGLGLFSLEFLLSIFQNFLWEYILNIDTYRDMLDFFFYGREIITFTAWIFLSFYFVSLLSKGKIVFLSEHFKSSALCAIIGAGLMFIYYLGYNVYNYFYVEDYFEYINSGSFGLGSLLAKWELISLMFNIYTHVVLFMALSLFGYYFYQQRIGNVGDRTLGLMSINHTSVWLALSAIILFILCKIVSDVFFITEQHIVRDGIFVNNFYEIWIYLCPILKTMAWVLVGSFFCSIYFKRSKA